VGEQRIPYYHQQQLCQFQQADTATVKKAIQTALKVKPEWEAMPFHDRCSIFLKAADLLSKKYRYQLMAATMLGQAKNVWQAEIDAAAELADFWRLIVYMLQIFTKHSH
jgi:1-pyrroline-5-carboxylate dehydrogenase